jgi:1,4-dihydroxy-2-naphthoate octaprenyltransferase
MTRKDLVTKLKGLVTLYRFIPVLSWSICAIILGTGLAIDHIGWRQINLSNLILMIFIVSMFQGFAAHAINDLYDWFSGTDKLSCGILSGGTDVLKNGTFSTRQLKIIGWLSLIAGTAGGLYLVKIYGGVILFLLLIGIWSTVSYTMPPIQLAYRPFAGEWLGAWPAMISCVLGTFYILTGHLTSLVAAASILHAAFSTAWLMQHHLPDIEADLQASPCKMTTVALVSRHWGQASAKYVVMYYFLLPVLLGLYFGLQYTPAFFISATFGVICMWLAYRTDSTDIKQTTSRQVKMIALSIGNALSLALIFTF